MTKKVNVFAVIRDFLVVALAILVGVQTFAPKPEPKDTLMTSLTVGGANSDSRIELKTDGGEPSIELWSKGKMVANLGTTSGGDMTLTLRDREQSGQLALVVGTATGSVLMFRDMKKEVNRVILGNLYGKPGLVVLREDGKTPDIAIPPMTSQPKE